MEATLIKGQDHCNVFVDKWDEGGIWLSIQTMHGGAHCTINPDQIKIMIETLQNLIGEKA